MSKSTLAKVLGWGSAILAYAGQVISQQSVLPHDAHGWLMLAASSVAGFAIHHASSTDGSK